MIFADLPASNALASPNALSNKRVGMVSYRQNHSILQPTAPAGGITNNPNDASWNWTFFDSAIAQATAFNIPCFLRVLFQSANSPAWVEATAQQFVSISDDSINVWWDTYFQSAVIAVIQAMAIRYGSNPLVKVLSFNIVTTSSGDWSLPHSTNANWTNSASFTCPAFGNTVNVPTGGVNAGMGLGQYCFIPSFGWFQATASSGSLHTTLLNPGIAGNANSGTVPINTTMQVNDVLTLQGPVYNYTTTRLVNAVTAILSATHTAWPNAVVDQEVGRNGTLDPFPGGTTYQYNAATQVCQWGYANIPVGKFAMGKNTLSGKNPVVSVALSQTDGSDLYLPAQTVAGSTNTSGTTGTIPAASRFNAQFLWQCYDPTGQYLPSTTGPNGKPFYANAGVPYLNPVPVFQYIVSLARNYGAQVLEIYEQDGINVLPYHGGYSSVNSYSRQPYAEPFQLLGMFCGLF